LQQPLLEFHDLTLGYGTHAAVHHLGGALERGSLTAIYGANGSGKSTLMKGIAGLLPAMSGGIVRQPGIRIAYLPQQSEIDRSFPARVVDLVSLGLWRYRGLLGRTRPEHRQSVAGALEAVGLTAFADRQIDTLSGGQMQRALFARVIVQDADLILLDEPFNAIDQRTVGDLLHLIERWHGEGRTVLAVLHDMELVRKNFPEALLLARRAVAWGPTQTVLTADNIARARQFNEAWVEDAPWCEADHADHDHKSRQPVAENDAVTRGAA
jgi:zinc/manganese transport system ATP-binding protein